MIRNGPELLRKLAVAARDEALDCFDAVAYARNNAERLDALLEIADRYKGPALVLGGGYILKNALMKKDTSVLAREAIDAMRKTEAAKWGRKAF
jgi:hypothetical protein